MQRHFIPCACLLGGLGSFPLSRQSLRFLFSHTNKAPRSPQEPVLTLIRCDRISPAHPAFCRPDDNVIMRSSPSAPTVPSQIDAARSLMKCVLICCQRMVSAWLTPEAPSLFSSFRFSLVPALSPLPKGCSLFLNATAELPADLRASRPVSVLWPPFGSSLIKASRCNVRCRAAVSFCSHWLVLHTRYSETPVAGTQG